MSAQRPPTPTSGALVLDFQGPFTPVPDLITGSGRPFVALRLFTNPDVAIYVTSYRDADALIAGLEEAKAMLRKARRDSA